MIEGYNQKISDLAGEGGDSFQDLVSMYKQKVSMGKHMHAHVHALSACMHTRARCPDVCARARAVGVYAPRTRCPHVRARACAVRMYAHTCF